MIIEFVIPGDPVAKQRARSVRYGNSVHHYTPEKTVTYERQVAVLGKQAMRGRSLIVSAVAVTMDICLAVPKSWPRTKRQAALDGLELPINKPDSDNVVKAVFDGLNKAVWKDDSQVVDLVLSKRYSENPCVNIRIEQIAALKGNLE